MTTYEITMVKRHLLNGYSVEAIARKFNVALSEIAVIANEQNEKELRKLRSIERANRPKKFIKDINARFRGVTV